MAEYRIQILPKDVEKVRGWFRDRGGCVVWSDQELHMPFRDDTITPATHEDGTPATPPHWSMGNPKPIKPEEIGVVTRTPVPLPPEWFPVCEYCQGTGRYMVHRIATARGVTVAEVIPTLTDCDLSPDKTTVRCSCENQCGHTGVHFQMKMRKHWTGDDVNRDSPKLQRILKRLHEHYEIDRATVIHSDVDYVGSGAMAYMKFYTETVAPFTLE